jgi:tRNA wybutosine-synthesizing protein 4
MQIELSSFTMDSVPTCFLSECVLVYLDAVSGNRIIQWAAQILNEVMFITYEQIRPNDAFGRTMLANLKVN